MIKEAYVSFEIAKLLKDKGFPQEYDIYHSMVYNEEDYEDEYEVQRMVLETRFVKAGTLSSYPVGVPEPKCYCPTHQMACAWLREKKYISIVITDDEIPLSYKYIIRKYFINDKYNLGVEVLKLDSTQFIKYEDAVEAALKYSLENLI